VGAAFAAQLLWALLLGALIGVERQWRRRLAGLQTNALVALGAAGFVAFSQMLPGEGSPTRVAAQVVTGVGFLGAGVIFRDGFGVRGLNTAATVWCSAAVGVLCGAGFLGHAAAMAALVVLVNLALRPLAGALAARVAGREAAAAGPVPYDIRLSCRAEDEARVRTLLLKRLREVEGLRLAALDSADAPGTAAAAARAEIAAEVEAPPAAEEALEEAVGALALDPAVLGTRWSRRGAEEG